MDDAERIAMIREGLPSKLPNHPGLDASVDHAPVRKQVLSSKEERLALESEILNFLHVVDRATEASERLSN